MRLAGNHVRTRIFIIAPSPNIGKKLPASGYAVELFFTEENCNFWTIFYFYPKMTAITSVSEFSLLLTAYQTKITLQAILLHCFSLRKTGKFLHSSRHKFLTTKKNILRILGSLFCIFSSTS